MIELTRDELNKAKEIKTETRNDALYELSIILGGKISDKFVWSKTSKEINYEGYRIGITTKKNKKGYIEIKSIDIFGTKNLDDWETYYL